MGTVPDISVVTMTADQETGFCAMTMSTGPSVVVVMKAEPAVSAVTTTVTGIFVAKMECQLGLSALRKTDADDVYVETKPATGTRSVP